MNHCCWKHHARLRSSHLVQPREVPHATAPSELTATISKACGKLGIEDALSKPFPRLPVPFQRSGVHLVTLAVALLTLSLLINFGNQVLQSTRLESRKALLSTEVAQLEAENGALHSAVEYAESDANVERVAREQLGYTREGDIVILPQFLAPTPAPTPVPQESAPLPVAEANWLRWWEAFFPPAETG